jgi:hypothetical protein
MQPTLDQLADGIFRLGYEDEETCPNGEPMLTTKGRKAFSDLEHGKDVPEFDCGREKLARVVVLLRLLTPREGPRALGLALELEH